jgi:putative tricarboxylic transport membrane protein
MLTLGIPGNAVTAALLGGLLIHGLIPGPLLFIEAPDVLYPFIFSLFLANLFFAVVAFFGLKYVAKVVLVPQGIVAPVVAALAIIGAYSFRNMGFDIWIMFGMGMLGYVLRKADYPLAPIILGIILGPMAEENLDRVLTLAQAANLSLMGYFIQRWLTVALMVLTIVTLAYSFLRGTDFGQKQEKNDPQ